MYKISPFQYLSNAFTSSSNVNFPNIRKGLVKMTFPSHFQDLNGSLSKSLIKFIKGLFSCSIGLFLKVLLSTKKNKKTFIIFLKNLFYSVSLPIHLTRGQMDMEVR